MLKIKEGVDLKELEKFGFKKFENIKPTWRSSYSRDWEKYKGETYTEIGYKFDDYRNEIIIVENRVNSDWKFIYKPKQIYVRESDWEAGVSMCAYDKVYDLIQAGLVEKVGDSDDREI